MDKTKEFQEKVKPLVEEMYRVCLELGVPFACYVTSKDQDDDVEGMSAAYLPKDGRFCVLRAMVELMDDKKGHYLAHAVLAFKELTEVDWRGLAGTKVVGGSHLN